MADNKVGIPKGTRDFGPENMIKRSYIFDTIRSVYKKYGFMPIETPAMENLSTLTGKYGDEGDKLLFKILNSGNYLSKTPSELLDKVPSKDEETANGLIKHISKKGLRYDLTVPFARFVVQHRNDIQFPFKRYQIQPVWRADRPQKGRYQEFYQCDADVIGSRSLLNELELIQIIDEVFTRFEISVTIKINNRKLLQGIAEKIGALDHFMDITVAIDKLDKIGVDKVKEELMAKGLNDSQIKEVLPLMQAGGSNQDKISLLKESFSGLEHGTKGISEMETLFELLDQVQIKHEVELDLSLARGLNYYTGCIIEVKANDIEMGSICGGGRYDDLTGIFGMPDVSGVGISFGADRIYDVLEEKNLYPNNALDNTSILFINFGQKEMLHCIGLVTALRKEGIAAEIYPDAAKMKKQMTYANNRNISFVALVGENEIQDQTITVKNMSNGEQNSLSIAEVIEMLK